MLLLWMIILIFDEINFVEFKSEVNSANIQLMYHNCICMLPLNIIVQMMVWERKKWRSQCCEYVKSFSYSCQLLWVTSLKKLTKSNFLFLSVFVKLSWIQLFTFFERPEKYYYVNFYVSYCMKINKIIYEFSPFCSFVYILNWFHKMFQTHYQAVNSY